MPVKENYLVTGSDGFVGRALVSYLLTKGETVRGSLWKPNEEVLEEIETIVVGSVDSDTDWAEALDSVDVIIHTAARVHMMNDDVVDPLAEFRKTNVEGTLNLARQAAQTGVKRFVFISSIKVNGESSLSKRVFTANDEPPPIDPYGISKYEAETGLKKISEETGLEVVIVRPPLVYGPGVKANFLAMMKWIKKGIPLPLGCINNRRSLVALDNLVDFLYCCATRPEAANRTFLISDNDDLSTSELLRKVAMAMGKKPFLIPVPVSWINFLAKFLGKGQVADRLLGSLQVDSSPAREILGWKPVVTVDQGLKKTVDYFLEHQCG